MENIRTIIQEVEQYAEAANVLPATVCSNATKNPRLYDRLLRRADRVDEDVRKLREYMARNPVSPSCEATQ